MLQPSLPRAVRETGIPSAVRVRFLMPQAKGVAEMGNGDRRDRTSFLRNINHTCTFTLITTDSRLPASVSATLIGMALCACRSASGWLS